MDFGRIVVKRLSMKSLFRLKERIICKKKFLHYFPEGFSDEKYYSWERGYKWEAHLAWKNALNKQEYDMLLSEENYSEISLRAVRLETKTNLLFSFEKMALRDAIKSHEGAKAFSEGLYEYVYGKHSFQKRFENFTDVLNLLPRKQTRVSTWPLQTVLGFIANPKENIFLKPRVTQIAAKNINMNLIIIQNPVGKLIKACLILPHKLKRIPLI